jgi:hypothetical protein
MGIDVESFDSEHVITDYAIFLANMKSVASTAMYVSIVRKFCKSVKNPLSVLQENDVVSYYQNSCKGKSPMTMRIIRLALATF